MTYRRISTAALCVALVITLLSGCKSNSNGWYADDGPSGDTSPTESLNPPTGSPSTDDSDTGFFLLSDIDLEAAFAAFPPDTVMIVAGDYTVTWEEVFFHIYGAMNYIFSSYGLVPNLSGQTSDGTTYADTILEYAAENALLYRGLEHGANLNGITLDGEDLDKYNSDFANLVELYGGEDGFLELLWESDGIRSLDLFQYIFRIGYLSNITFEKNYGVDGSLLSDEDVAELTANDGYLMAKHILRMKTEDGDDAPLRECEAVLNQLKAYDGGDFGAFFDELMFEHSEDTGLEVFPDGYLFQYGDMVQEFYDTCMALEIGAYSGIVETEYGYHIIYRIPLNYDVVPSAYAMTDDYRTLRDLIAMNLFDKAIYDWIDLLEVEYTEAYNSIDVAAIFSA